MVKERVLRSLGEIRVGSIPTPRIFFEAPSRRKNALEKTTPNREWSFYIQLSAVSPQNYMMI